MIVIKNHCIQTKPIISQSLLQMPKAVNADCFRCTLFGHVRSTPAGVLTTFFLYSVPCSLRFSHILKGHFIPHQNVTYCSSISFLSIVSVLVICARLSTRRQREPTTLPHISWPRICEVVHYTSQWQYSATGLPLSVSLKLSSGLLKNVTSSQT